MRRLLPPHAPPHYPPQPWDPADLGEPLNVCENFHFPRVFPRGRSPPLSDSGVCSESRLFSAGGKTNTTAREGGTVGKDRMMEDVFFSQAKADLALLFFGHIR